MVDLEWDMIQQRIAMLGDASPTDYCVRCGESPESATHILGDHTYEDPRLITKVETYTKVKNPIKIDFPDFPVVQLTWWERLKARFL